MKNKFLLLVAVFTIMLFSSSTTVPTVDVQGTWKLIESSGNPMPATFEQIKLITDNYFFWYRSDAEGKVYTGAGGSYTVKDNTYTETISSALPGMTNYLGKKAAYEVKIEGDKMYISGTLDGNFKNTEIWKRVTNSSK